MQDYQSVYFYDRKTGRAVTARAKKKRRKRGAGLLIAVLLILSVAICLLVVFLPKFAVGDASSEIDFRGKTFYALTTSVSDDKATARLAAEYASERGGAGYIYNDGKYRVIAALYEREADAKSLVAVNPDSAYFAFSVPAVKCENGDKRVLEFITGEWFAEVFTAVTELDRGALTEAEAQHAAVAAGLKLRKVAQSAENPLLKTVAESAVDCDEHGESVLSDIRYTIARVITETAMCYV